MLFSDPRKLLKQIKKDVEQSFGVAIAKVNVELDRVIESGSEFADLGFSGQDIIDSERLKDSKVVSSSPNSVTFTYEPKSPENGYPYAPAVYEGFFAWGRKYIPGRPWTDRAVFNENPVKNMAFYLDNLGYNVTIVRDGITNQ